MGLTTPLALLGLLGVVLPVVAHFVRSRQLPPQSFPPLMLLARASHARRRQSALVDRLLLALRVMAVTALALALAGPTLSLTDRTRGGVEDLVVVLDDSLSMIRADASTSPLSRARAALREELSQLPDHSGVALVLAGEPARVVVPAGSSPSDVAAALDNRSGARAGDMARAADLARRELGRAPHARRRLLVLSDMARNSGVADVDWSAAGVAVHFFDAQPAAPPPNRRIVGVRANIRGPQGTLQVSAAGITEDTYASLWVQDRELARGLLTAGPGTRRMTLRFAAEAGTVLPAEVRLEGDDPLPTDDRWPLWLRPEPQAALLVVDGSPDPTGRRGEASFLAHALEAGQSLGAPSFQVVDEAALANLTPGSQGAVILAGALPSRRALRNLRRFVRAGGGLWVAPSAKLRWRAMNSRLGDLLPAHLSPPSRRSGERAITVGAAGSGLREVDFAGATLGPTLSIEDVNEDARVWLRQGTPLMIEGRSGRGRVFLLAAPLGDRLGDFPYRPGYLPMVLQVCARLVGDERGVPRVVIAGSVALLPSGVHGAQVETPRGELAVLPPDGHFGDTSTVGLYRVLDPSGPRPNLRFSVVAPPAESDLTPGRTPLDIHDSEPDAATSERTRAKPLAPWFYLFAGLLVAAEGILRASRLSGAASVRR